MYYPQEIGCNMDEIVRVVNALQISDKQGAVPAGWSNNELIKDRIIVSPPSDIREAKKRLEDKSLSALTGGSATSLLKNRANTA